MQLKAFGPTGQPPQTKEKLRYDVMLEDVPCEEMIAYGE
jgi:hypothetical protein